MKIALCLQGLSSGKNDKDDLVLFEAGAATIYENIIDINNVDVFIHTWMENEAHVKKINAVYSPQDSSFDKQITFRPNKEIPRSLQNPNRYHSIKSRWYSHQKALELKKEYEKKHNFKYDFVMISRFDVHYFSPFHFGEYDPSFFYASDDFLFPDRGLNDVWFFSNSEVMDKFSTVYDHLDSYVGDNKTQSSREICAHAISRAHIVATGLEDKIKYTKKISTDYQLSRRL